MPINMSNNYFHRAQFALSAASLAQLPNDEGAEVAFVGRSNAGKSSALNALVNNKHLARTSNTPGRTQLINVFTLDDSRRLIDLPGYGYARVPLEVKHRWQETLAAYLDQRQCLRGLVLLMDARHPLQPTDQELLQWTMRSNISVHVLLTKADKLSRNIASRTLQQVKLGLANFNPNASVQLFSVPAKIGIDAARAQLATWLEL